VDPDERTTIDKDALLERGEALLQESRALLADLERVLEPAPTEQRDSVS